MKFATQISPLIKNFNFFRKYLAVVVPIVAMFGPFGAYIAAYLHGYVKAFLVFALSTVALVSYACYIHAILW